MTARKPRPEQPRAFIAYSGNLYPEHAMADFALISPRYTDIVLPFTQENAKYDVAAYSDLVGVAHSYGLKAWISPWGGRSFGGEGVDSGMGLRSWLAAALAASPDGIHFDEPKFPIRVLDSLVASCAAVETMVSLEAERAFLVAPHLPRIDILATEAYSPDPSVGLHVARRLKDTTPTPVVVWAQAFRVPRGHEAIPGAVLSTAVAHGLIPGVWSWMGGRGRGVLMSDEPEAVQISVDTALAMAWS